MTRHVPDETPLSSSQTEPEFSSQEPLDELAEADASLAQATAHTAAVARAEAHEDTGSTAQEPPKSLRAAAESGLFWAVVSRWGARFASILGLIVLVRYVQPSEFGLAAAVASVLSLVQVLAEGGLTSYLVSSRQNDQRTLSTAFWVNVGLSLMLGLVVLVLAPVVQSLMGVHGLANLLRWTPITLAAIGVATVPSALLQQRLQFRSLAIRQLLGVFCGMVTAVTLAVSGAGAWALVAQAMVQNIIAAVVLLSQARWRPSLRFDRASVGPLATFGSKSAGVAVLSQLRDRTEDFLIGSTLGVAALGQWAVAGRTTRLIADLTNSLVQTVSLPLLAQVNHDRGRMTKAYSKMLSISMSALAPALTLTSLTAPDLIPTVFGSQWQPAVHPAQLIALSSVLAGISTYDRAFYFSAGRPGIELCLSIGLVATAVVGIIIAAPHGTTVLATVSLVRTVFFVAIRITTMRRTCGVKFETFREPLSVVASAIVPGAIIHGASLAVGLGHGLLPAALKIALFVPAYAICVYFVARGTFEELRKMALRLLHAGLRPIKRALPGQNMASRPAA